MTVCQNDMGLQKSVNFKKVMRFLSCVNFLVTSANDHFCANFCVNLSFWLVIDLKFYFSYILFLSLFFNFEYPIASTLNIFSIPDSLFFFGLESPISLILIPYHISDSLFFGLESTIPLTFNSFLFLTL